MTGEYDAIIVVGGHNGLVAAAYLARTGWDSVVLERNESVGGAVRSGELTREGFVHDGFIESAEGSGFHCLTTCSTL